MMMLSLFAQFIPKKPFEEMFIFILSDISQNQKESVSEWFDTRHTDKQSIKKTGNKNPGDTFFSRDHSSHGFMAYYLRKFLNTPSVAILDSKKTQINKVGNPFNKKRVEAAEKILEKIKISLAESNKKLVQIDKNIHKPSNKKGGYLQIQHLETVMRTISKYPDASLSISQQSPAELDSKKKGESWQRKGKKKIKILRTNKICVLDEGKMRWNISRSTHLDKRLNKKKYDKKEYTNLIEKIPKELFGRCKVLYPNKKMEISRSGFQ